MANLNELKTVKVNELSDSDLANLKQDVLTLNEEEVVDYLYHLIDNEYELSDEENTTQVAKFLRETEFKTYFDKIILENEETADAAE